MCTRRRIGLGQTYFLLGGAVDAMEIQHEDDLLIIEDVARAVEENEFVPYVQPAFELSTGRVVAGETLVRWVLPEDNTLVPAGAFVPSLERTNTICGLDWCMIDAVCTFMGQADVAGVSISLNLSHQHAQDKDFAKRLAATADWHKVDHKLLWAEMSAQTIMGDTHVIDELVPAVKEAGFRIVADKFTGDANDLRELHAKGVNLVKVSAAVWRDGDAATIAELVRVAEEVGVSLNAEGVEDGAERQKVTKDGFRYAQGFGFAHPMPLEDFAVLCKR